jgi:ATP-dependent RNA helicase SUPV3L1/SUV3
LQHDASHLSCTIEMADFSTVYDVAVIDEIQMIEDSERGYAWTNAILGLQAKEIHLCGDERALKLITNIVEATQDTVRAFSIYLPSWCS